MLLIVLIAVIYNLFTLELLFNEKLEMTSDLSAPFGVNMGALIVGLNLSDKGIPKSSRICHTKIECLQIMCQTSNLPNCNSLQVYPFPDLLNNPCNVTLEENIITVYVKWQVIILIILISNLLILTFLCVYVILKYYQCVNVLLEIILILMTGILYATQLGFIIYLASLLLAEQYHSTLYNIVHISIILCTTIVINILFVIVVIAHNISDKEPVEAEF
jgi:hypothetical protein